jgi:hypothetical protein
MGSQNDEVIPATQTFPSSALAVQSLWVGINFVDIPDARARNGVSLAAIDATFDGTLKENIYDLKPQ